MPAYNTSRGGRESNEHKFRLFTAFKLDFLSFVAHFIQWNETNFIGFLFCRVDEFHTRRMKNEKVATFCSQAKKYRCLVTNSSGIINLLFHVLRDNNSRTLYSSLAFLAFDDPILPRSCGTRKYTTQLVKCSRVLSPVKHQIRRMFIVKTCFEINEIIR